MSYMKGARSGSEGNTRLLKQYGGGSTAPRQHYATGGAVKSGNPSLAEGLSAAGKPAKPSLARPGRKMAKGDKKGKGTNVNVVILQKPDGPKPDMPMPMAGPAGPLPPPDAPLPMRKHGGRVKKADGGSTISEDSKQEAAKLREEQSNRRGTALSHALQGIGVAAVNAIPGGKIARRIGHGLTGANAALAGINAIGSRKAGMEADRIEKGLAEPGKEDRKRGGAVSKSDEAVKIAKSEESYNKGGKVCRAPGGPVMGLKNKNGGAGGAAGRLAKVRMYGK